MWLRRVPSPHRTASGTALTAPAATTSIHLHSTAPPQELLPCRVYVRSLLSFGHAGLQFDANASVSNPRLFAVLLTGGLSSGFRSIWQMAPVPKLKMRPLWPAAIVRLTLVFRAPAASARNSRSISRLRWELRLLARTTLNHSSQPQFWWALRMPPKR